MIRRDQTRHLISVAATAFVLTAASAQAQTSKAPDHSSSSHSTSAMDSSNSKMSNNSTMSESGQVSKEDAKFFENIAQANLAEIEAGKLALEKSQNAEIKAFAQKMIDDHGKALQELQALAQRKSITLPTEPDMAHRTLITGMKALSGDTFDHQYIARAGVGDHKRTHELLTKVKTETKDADLRAYAEKTLPAVDMHWNMAKEFKLKQK